METKLKPTNLLDGNVKLEQRIWLVEWETVKVQVFRVNGVPVASGWLVNCPRAASALHVSSNESNAVKIMKSVSNHQA